MKKHFDRAMFLLGTMAAVFVPELQAGSWPQFRGPNASSRAEGDARLPDQIGPTQNVIWKIALPPGHSGPVVVGDRVYVTAVRDKKLLTLALDAKSGKVLWEKVAPHKTLEKIHSIGSHAQPTPATDGELVVSFFGSSGLFCYDRDGKELWHRAFDTFKNDFGAGSSPILVGDWVILNQDHDTDSFLMAIDKHSGKTVWKADRSEFPRSYATPVIWEVGGRKQIVVAGTLRAIGYEFETGKELWTVRGLARIVNMTPTVGDDGILYLPTWAPGGDDDDRITVEPFDDIIAKSDANKNGMLEAGEVPDGPLKQRFTQIDRDKDGHITKAEFENMRQIFHSAKNRVVAVRPGGNGDITASHVLWEQKKALPYVPSPLYHKGHLYYVRNGLLTCLDAKTGAVIRQDRVYGTSTFYSSPVYGDGKIYLLSEHGECSVISAGPQWKILSRAKFDEKAYATPAIADGRIYLRTAGHLYCLGLSTAE